MSNSRGDLSRQLSGAYSSIMLQLSTVAPGNIVVEKEQRETFLQLYNARVYKMYRRYGTANSLLERCCPVCCQNRLLAQRARFLPRLAAAWCGICVGRSD